MRRPVLKIRRDGGIRKFVCPIYLAEFLCLDRNALSHIPPSFDKTNCFWSVRSSYQTNCSMWVRVCTPSKNSYFLLKLNHLPLVVSDISLLKYFLGCFRYLASDTLSSDTSFKYFQQNSMFWICSKASGYVHTLFKYILIDERPVYLCGNDTQLLLSSQPAKHFDTFIFYLHQIRSSASLSLAAFRRASRHTASKFRAFRLPDKFRQRWFF